MEPGKNNEAIERFLNLSYLNAGETILLPSIDITYIFVLQQLNHEKSLQLLSLAFNKVHSYVFGVANLVTAEKKA